ncbi:malate synthase A [Pseudenhygromyxa sp. WMMC2535]|uniref:malate synthase A n=1 Tax=Pseudenhygromyxa sp. WMMC2535 TaxID=2712867 RepID=UPI001551E3D4|nr:malate synthase A [Pseudenhygromyxa sp. WMMC2535]NVB40751.1 malate synthase A [Pseudenhygromyxa sp. WMMC2535]
MMTEAPAPLRVAAEPLPGSGRVLTAEALAFVGALCAEFQPQIDALLARRREVQARYDAGERPDFLAATEEVRKASWRVAEAPADLRKRTVEITGPIDAKMIINALNSGADVFMADCEDATSPTWANVVSGQAALIDAVRGTLEFVDEAKGKHYKLRPAQERATLLVRPRGLHMKEVHLRFGDLPAAASLVDFGLYFFHNARELIARGSGPYFYLPKLESHLEARLWNEVFVRAQALLDIPRGTVRATVLIETLPAAFEMDEILYELREHSAGLNCGRWDYIFSAIKTLRTDPSRVFPDRGAVGMTQPFMRAYALLSIRTCHRRGAHAMGGMAAQIPRPGPENEVALAKVAEDKRREAQDGHDGTWVAHPGLIPTAREAFAAVTTADNQLDRLRDDVEVSAAQLLEPPAGPRSEAGLRLNVRVGIEYLEAWLCGRGCVPINWLMEDAATAEISRAQLWQWRRHAAALDDGRTVDAALIESVITEELAGLREALGSERFDAGRFTLAAQLFRKLVLADELADFLTLEAYEHLD